MKLTSCVFWVGIWFLCSIAVQAEHKKPDVASLSDSKSKSKAVDDKFDNTLPFPSAQTEPEKLLKLQQKLNRRLQDFDEMLLIEKDLLSEQKRASRAGSDVGRESSDNDGGNQFDDSGSGQSGNSDTAGATRGGFSKKNRTNGDIRGNRQSKQDTGRVMEPGKPADISSGYDDDIVARQLREAAEKETDPALRKKLWDEYKRYKKGNN